MDARSRGSRLKTPFVLLSVLSMCPLQASEAPSPRVATITMPKLLPKQNIPSLYPQRAMAEGREALLYLELDISAEGKVTRATVVDGGFYSPDIAKAVVKMALSYRFEPPMQGGKAVDFVGFRVPTRFRMNGVGGLSRDFRKEAGEVVALLQAGDTAGAHVHAEGMLANEVQRFSEYAALQYTLAQTHYRLKNNHSALRAARAATTPDRGLVGTGSAEYMLKPDGLRPMLMIRFAVGATEGAYADSLEAFDHMDMLGLLEADSPLRAEALKVRQHVETAPELVARVRIDDSRIWSHRLLRESFTVVDLRGELTGPMHLICAGRRSTLEYAPDSTWTIPTAWEDCRLDFSGKPGTELQLVETGSSASVSAEPPSDPPRG